MAQPETRVAIVTGAASGIGLETARALKAAGYRVFGTSRKVDQVVEGDITMLPCDLTSDASVAGAVVTISSRTGRIDLLVNNAGFGISGGAEESSIAQAQALFDVNLFGAIRMTRAVLPLMRAGGGGRIVNISSLFGLVPAPYMALYAASKHALEGYSESLDYEVRTQGIRVVLVEPAYTRTAFDRNLVSPDAPLAVYDAARAGQERLMRDVTAAADAPAAVAETVVKAAKATVPKVRYTVGTMARRVSLLRRFVPAGAFDKGIRKQMRLPQ